MVSHCFSIPGFNNSKTYGKLKRVRMGEPPRSISGKWEGHAAGSFLSFPLMVSVLYYDLIYLVRINNQIPISAFEIKMKDKEVLSLQST